jgi:hypothetical protein
MQRSRKTLFVTAGVAAVAIGAALLLHGSFRRGATAHASPAPDLLSALPAGAPTLVYLDLAAVRASSFYQHRPDRGPIVVPDADYANFMRSTGFDFEKDLDRVVIASWPSAGDKEPGPDVVIADGRFDREKIRGYALRTGKLDRQQGHDVFLFSTSGRPNWNSVTFLDDRRIALVRGASIAPLFSGNGANSVGDPARERAARLDGAAAFAILPMPPLPAHFAPGGVQSDQLASLARSVQWITLAARPEGDSSTDARQLQSMLELLRMFGRAGLENPKTRQSMDAATLAMVQNLLKTAEITQAAERVRILVEVTPNMLKLGKAFLPNESR